MFKIKGSSGEARAGTFFLPSGRDIETPAMILYSRRGGSLHMTPDILDTLEPECRAIQVCMTNFFGNALNTLENYPGSFRDFLAINPKLAVLATIRDPTTFEFQTALRHSTDQVLSVTTHTQSMTITPDMYMKAASVVQPDVLISICDEIASDSKRSRAVLSVDRSLGWLTECLHDTRYNGPIIASIQGARYLDYRDQCASGVAQAMQLNERIVGVSFGGFGTGESLEERSEIIEICLKRIKYDAVRVVSSIDSPEEILHAISQGIDLFNSSYVTDATLEGYALNFPINSNDYYEESIADTIENGGDDTKINLWATQYKTDRRPLVEGCICIACTSHTRAYIHHLLEAHEMTVQVLLDAHNTTHYLRFFKAIREALVNGTFGEYQARFLERKQRFLVNMN